MNANAIQSRQEGSVASASNSVSVVIPAHNEEASIVRCLHAVLTQTVPPLEIIVVDNLSSDRTADRVRAVASEYHDVPIRLLSQHSELGLVPTRNMGLDAATGTIVARIDADTAVDRDWIANILTAMARHDSAGISGPVSYYDLPFQKTIGALDHLTRSALSVANHETQFLFGSNMALRRTAWLAIRHTVCRDHEDLFHEDIDLALHLQEARLPVRYEPTMRASISARRLTDTPDRFRHYTRRFDRTYAAHGKTGRTLNVAGAMLRFVHPLGYALHVRATRPSQNIAASLTRRTRVVRGATAVSAQTVLSDKTMAQS